MFDARSTSSQGLSNLSVMTSNNLNPLSTIHPALLSKIKKQVQLYEGATSKCAAIWQALKKNDIAGFRLSEKVIEVIFQQFQEDLYNLTKIGSLKEFMSIFDHDKDGFLNEDEQIKIFSYIKERMELMANNALKIQAYASFKSLMKEVRQLEANITKWQEHLRQKVHAQQLTKYKTIGEQRIDEFCEEFDREFDNLNRIKIARRQTFEKQAMNQMQRLEEKLGQASQYMKIKPKSKLKELQMQEKLVSLEERVEEALDFRKQLNELEVSEKQRVDRLMMENAQHQRENLRRKHEKNRRELEIKLQELEFKLIIRMKKEFDILIKKNHLHENEITRIQNLSAKWAVRKGTFEPELKRTKKLEKRRNEILSEYKRSLKGGSDIRLEDDTAQPFTTNITSSLSVNKKDSISRFATSSILEATTNFEITKKSQSELPVNKPTQDFRNMSGKLEKYLQEKKKTEKMYSLTGMYDENLEKRGEMPVLSANSEMAEKARRRNFILSKIF